MEHPGFDSVSLDKDSVGSDSRLKQMKVQRKKVNELTKIVDQEKDRNLRLQAEIENIRKRSINDVTNARKFAIESFATNLLSVADSLETALNTEDQTFEQLKGGLSSLLNNLSRLLSVPTLRQFSQKLERNSTRIGIKLFPQNL